MFQLNFVNRIKFLAVVGFFLDLQRRLTLFYFVTEKKTDWIWQTGSLISQLKLIKIQTESDRR